MDQFEINTPARQAAFLAQVDVESGSLLYVSELASGVAYDGRADLGNTDPRAIAIASAHGTTPGPWWKGHGLIQITGFTNHGRCGDALGLDLLNSPTLLCEPGNAAASAGWFWQTHGLNEIADVGDLLTITKKINGGLNGYAQRLACFGVAQQVLGVA
jgi:putative chitinase